MHKCGVFPTQIVAKLPDSFQKRLAFNVANSPTDLYQGNIRVGRTGEQVNPPFDLIGDMGMTWMVPPR